MRVLVLRYVLSAVRILYGWHGCLPFIQPLTKCHNYQQHQPRLEEQNTTAGMPVRIHLSSASVVHRITGRKAYYKYKINPLWKSFWTINFQVSCGFYLDFLDSKILVHLGHWLYCLRQCLQLHGHCIIIIIAYITNPIECKCYKKPLKYNAENAKLSHYSKIIFFNTIWKLYLN